MWSQAVGKTADYDSAKIIMETQTHTHTDAHADVSSSCDELADMRGQP